MIYRLSIHKNKNDYLSARLEILQTPQHLMGLAIDLFQDRLYNEAFYYANFSRNTQAWTWDFVSSSGHSDYPDISKKILDILHKRGIFIHEKIKHLTPSKMVVIPFVTDQYIA